jgi:glutathione synthase/RimK-type ligase-like ATP-grasp enzyme
LVAQEFLQSDFDWRIGVLSGRCLYACKYFMARGHWQIQVSSGSTRRYGRHETLPLEQVPEGVLSLALRACALVGEGLYGVDIKEVDGKFFIIEINDNPSIEAGCEDAIAGEELYLSIARCLVERVESRLRSNGTRDKPQSEPAFAIAAPSTTSASEQTPTAAKASP